MYLCFTESFKEERVMPKETFRELEVNHDFEISLEKVDGFVPLKFDLGIDFGNTVYGELELKGQYFLGLASGDYVKPNLTNTERLENKIKTWCNSHNNAANEIGFLNMLVRTACSFVAFVNPSMDMECEAMLAFHYLSVNWWTMDDIIDQPASKNSNVRISEFYF